MNKPVTNIHQEDSGPHAFDRLVNAALGRITTGIAPTAVTLAYLDWLVHLGISPAKQFQLWEKAVRKSSRFGLYTMQHLLSRDTEPCVEPLPQDKRFAAPEWKRWPYNLFYQGFLLNQQWWWNATTGVGGVSQHHENVVWFTTRQWLDVFSPANFLFTNPEIFNATIREGGANLVRGAVNFMDDTRRQLEKKSPKGAENFKVGEQVAVTPGKVVFRNRLIELIQYAPTTDKVQAEPFIAAQFVGEIFARSRPYGVHGLVEKSGSRGP